MEKLEAGVRNLGLSLNKRQLAQFRIYYQELVDWNRRVNLTSITDREEVQIKHFLDSLTVILALGRSADRAGLHVLDVGAGAGFPGLPLKILLPDTRLVLLDATAKKTGFLNQLATRLGLDGVSVITGRAENVAHEDGYREKVDVVLSRAVASLSVLTELTLPFCALGGSFVAQKKGAIDAEIHDADRAIDILGGRLREVKAVDLEELNDQRWLIIIDKVKATPPQYPRRPGIPAKRPILA